MLLAGKLIILFLFYFLAARIGLTLDAVGGFASLVWPAAGIGLAAIFLGGYKLWPAVFLAAFSANFLNGASIPAAIGIGSGNTLEAVLGSFLLKKILNFDPSFERLQDALSLVNVSILSPVISATIGVTSLFLDGIITPAVFEPAWLTWWTGDLLGIMLVSPLLFVWSKPKQFLIKKTESRYLLDIVVSFAVLVIACLAFFKGLFGINAKTIPITQTLYPMLIWFAIRFSPQLSFTAISTVALIAIWGTVSGTGPFIRGRLSENLLYLQAFLATIALTFTILTSLMAERRKLQALKDEFISAASHELRTPITTIKAYNDLIAKTLGKNSGLIRKNPSLKIYTARMNEQITRLINLIYELLDVSRIEAGKIKINPERFSLSKLIEETAADFKRTTKSHVVIYKGSDNFIYADKFRISQVLVNLISNAIKFSPKSDKVLVLCKKDLDFVTVSVKDYGVGIDPKYQNKIFSRFFQASQNIKSDSAGLGLGLYISSEIIKQHRGQIWVDSKPKKGSVFSFKLPLNKAKF